MEDLVYWLWLSCACTPGKETFKKLLTKYETPKAVYLADGQELSSCIGARCCDLAALSDKNLQKAETILNFCQTKNVGILTYSDTRYPTLLKKISNPPVLLYYRGVLPDFENSVLVSVVGTRSLSDYGRKNAFTISRDLAKSGAVIVSGMAIGIDGVALAGALSEGKSTVAVIGSGIDVCYPNAHRRLAQEIVKRGCVFTEFPPGTPPNRYNFPCRNRIISALSEATIVIEGKERSGAVITARCAKSQGRVVYALPGNVGNRNSEATNLLIKNGAKPIISADDVLKNNEIPSFSRLNPYKMLEPSSRDMMNILSEFQVEALTPGDDVFKCKVSKKAKVKTDSISETSQTNQDKINNKLINFDKAAVKLYQKIPQNGVCSVESLVEAEYPLRDVMRLLLKLEIACFITMLPGDKVKRR